MSTIKANTLLHSDGSTTNPPAIPALNNRMATAWVHWNASGTVAILDNYNVSSITDSGTGNFSVNFSTAMPTANYSVVVAGRAGSAGTGHGANTYTYSHSTGSVAVVQLSYAGAYMDLTGMSAVIFGGQ